MAIKLSDSIRVGQQKPLEDKYFNELNPYTSTTQVNTLLLKAVRHIGLTVNINGEEYWYKDGIEDENLIKKLDFTSKDYSFDRKQLGFFEYYKENGQRVKKPYYSQMFRIESDGNGNYDFIEIPEIEKLLDNKAFQDVSLAPISNVELYSIVQTGNLPYLEVFNYYNVINFSVELGIQYSQFYTVNSVDISTGTLSNTDSGYVDNGPITIYIEFTSIEDEEIIIN